MKDDRFSEEDLRAVREAADMGIVQFGADLVERLETALRLPRGQRREPTCRGRTTSACWRSACGGSG